jgi:hypothetical protein
MDSSYCAMNKHYILTINPNAKHDWDRCSLREPLTAKRADLAKLISDTIEQESGSYLVSVNIEVTVLEKAPLPQVEQLTLNLPELSVQSAPQELVA